MEEEPASQAQIPEPPPLQRRKRGLGFWLLVSGGALAAVCGGLIVSLWDHVERIYGIATAPPEERQALFSQQLEAMAGTCPVAVDRFLAAVDRGDDDLAYDLVSAGFRQSATRERFGELADTVRAVMGPLKTKSLVNFHSKQVLGGSSLTTLVYAGKFEKGDGAITLHLEASGDSWRVHFWRTDSPLFEAAMRKGAGK